MNIYSEEAPNFSPEYKTDIIFWLTLTMYHECRNESEEGQKNVVKVIMNRAKLNNWPVSNVVKARKQFSCFNNGLNHESVWIKNVVSAGRVCLLAEKGLAEWFDGLTLGGATHYYAPLGMPGGKAPYWIVDMELITVVGGHRFYRENLKRV